MGRILSIRLSAVTFNTEDVFRAWPLLCTMAWPEKGYISNGVWCPLPMSAALAPPVVSEQPRYGVHELVHELLEEFEFGDWDTSLKEKAQEGMSALRQAFASLENALANWKPQLANTATDAIEDALDRLELELAPGLR